MLFSIPAENPASLEEKPKQQVIIHVVGSKDAGKTKLCKRYAEDCYSDATFNDYFDFLTKQINLNGYLVKILIREHTISSNVDYKYYDRPHAVLLLHDMTNIDDSLDLTETRIKGLKQKFPNAEIVLAGTKCDNLSKKVIDEAPLFKLANNNQCNVAIVSAKNAINVEALFEATCKEVLAARQSASSAAQQKLNIRQSIEARITELKTGKKEQKRSCFFFLYYFSIKTKKGKIAALKDILTKISSDKADIKGIVTAARKEHPILDAGFFSSKTKTLLDSIASTPPHNPK